MKRKAHAFPYVIALLLIFLPNLNLIDPLPDFIAWFLLAAAIGRASDIAPFFAEAKSAFYKLAWLDLVKTAMILFVYGGQSDGRGDTVALAALVFAALDLLLVIPAVYNFYEGLFHLGERSDALMLIAPTTRGGRKFSVDSLKALTYAFFAVKYLAATLPEFLLLSFNSSMEDAHRVNGRTIYPFAVAFAILLVTVLGVIFLIRALRYLGAIRREGKYDEALDGLLRDGTERAFENRVRARRFQTASWLFVFGAIFTIELPLDNLDGAGILPTFFFPLLAIAAFSLLRSYLPRESAHVTVSAAIYAVFSLLAYVIKCIFLVRFGYRAIAESDDAARFYRIVNLTALIEGLSAILFFALLFLLYRKAIRTYTGILPGSEHYRAMDATYHKSLTVRALILSGIGALGAVFRVMDTRFSGIVRILEIKRDDFTKYTVVTGSVEWFGTVVTFAAIALIFFAAHFYSTLKDEMALKTDYEG